MAGCPLFLSAALRVALSQSGAIVLAGDPGRFEKILKQKNVRLITLFSYKGEPNCSVGGARWMAADIVFWVMIRACRVMHP